MPSAEAALLWRLESVNPIPALKVPPGLFHPALMYPENANDVVIAGRRGDDAVMILLRTAVGSTPIRESWLVIDWERPKIHP